MAGAAEGAVIACHTEDEFHPQMAKGKDAAGKLVIIDFMTPWCPGCKLMAPVYAKCANKYPDAVFQVNINELKEVADKYGIHSIPTFNFIRNGETLDSFGTTDPEELEDAIKLYY